MLRGAVPVTIARAAYTNATIATPSVSYTYDPVYPRVTQMTDGTGSTTYSYNPITSTPTLGAGRLGSVTTPLTTISYTYDELGRQLSQTIGGTAASVVYDTLGRVQTATNALGTFNYTYLNQTGRVTTRDVVGSSFILDIPISFGHGCDLFSYGR